MTESSKLRLLFDAAEAEVFVEELDEQSRRVSVEPKSPGAYVHRRSVETTYPDDLIVSLYEAKGPAFLCDEIARDQDPGYLQQHLTLTIVAHVDPASLSGRRILDFGCGAGASTSVLGRLLPDCAIDGVELDAANIRAATTRAAFNGLQHVRFLQSPQGDQLPIELGSYDAVVLSAVYEHLLPHERRRLMPMLWSRVRPGGYLFVDETPWRWFPIESHTTGLPLLNYTTDRIAHRLARRSSKLSGRTRWDEFQRAGIRGGTVHSIVDDLAARPGEASVLAPSRLGIGDPVDLWYEGYAAGTGAVHHRRAKQSAHGILKTVYRTTGQAPVPYLSLAIQKLA
jgi:2-polyprenyl-3-methyl-5-hydroxy-6-metoxy-1,4-benzoquinol methylase